MPCEVRKCRVGGRKSTKPGGCDRGLVCATIYKVNGPCPRLGQRYSDQMFLLCSLRILATTLHTLMCATVLYRQLASMEVRQM